MKYRANFQTFPARLEPVYSPVTKHKLLETIQAMRPEYDIKPLGGMSKKRLYAIYFTLRRKAGR